MNTNTERRSPWTARLDLAATILLIVVALFIGGVIMWDRLSPPAAQAGATARSPLHLPPEPISIEGATIRGDRNAKVALIEFSEFECPFCARSARDVLPEIERQYLRT